MISENYLENCYVLWCATAWVVQGKAWGVGGGYHYPKELGAMRMAVAYTLAVFCWHSAIMGYTFEVVLIS